MTDRIVLKWTSKIQSFARKGLINRALFWFLRMQRAGIVPNETTYSTTLTVSARSTHKAFGFGLHGLVLKKGYSGQHFVSSGLISMYCKYGRIRDARRVFDEMPERDGVVWNTMISGYTQSGLNDEACRLFSELVRGFSHRSGFVNDYTLASISSACADEGWTILGESVHGFATKIGFDSDAFVGSSLVDMYAKCGELISARCVFDGLRNRDIVVWNSMITGYAQNGYEDEAIELFVRMQHQRLLPNDTTFSAIANASSAMVDDFLGRSLHAMILKFGHLSEIYTGTALADMYAKFLSMADAERAISEMPKKNEVSYNALITGYGLIGDCESAFRTFTFLRLQGLGTDACTYIGLFTACASSCAFIEGMQVHSHTIMLGLNLDISVRNSIVNFYSKCRYIDYAMKEFETAQKIDAFSWSAIISGLVQNNESNKALDIFCEMHRLSEKPDDFSCSSVIKAVASLAGIIQGRHLHAHMIKSGLDRKIFVGSSLIDMYSKCGMVEDAHRLFSEMPEKNVVSWNSMITGYARNGFAEDALLLFHEMEKSGIIPTSATFVGILLACCNAGMVEEGKHYYHLMKSCYGISPSVEHCTCMVNILGRSGYVAEAEEFLLSSPYNEEHGIWKSLLASCEAHRDFDVAARVAEQCLRLKPDDPSTYTILSNIYATKQMWSEVGTARDSMKAIPVVKEPGCSWIEATN